MKSRIILTIIGLGIPLVILIIALQSPSSPTDKPVEKPVQQQASSDADKRKERKEISVEPVMLPPTDGQPADNTGIKTLVPTATASVAVPTPTAAKAAPAVTSIDGLMALVPRETLEQARGYARQREDELQAMTEQDWVRAQQEVPDDQLVWRTMTYDQKREFMKWYLQKQQAQQPAK